MAAGYTYIVFAKEDGPAPVRDCAPTRKLPADERVCFMYTFRKRAGLSDAVNPVCDERNRIQREYEQRMLERS